jgi:phage terminase small subunit
MAGPPVPLSAPPANLADITRGLSEKAVRFAELRASGLSLHRAAALAGYEAKNTRNFTSIGYGLARDPRVASLMAHFAANMVRAAAPRAVKVLSDIMEDPKVKPADRTRAAKGLLDKTLPTLQHHETEGRLQHQHEHTIRQAPSMDDLRREAAGHLPAPASNVTDAEFEVIEAHPEDWTV